MQLEDSTKIILKVIFAGLALVFLWIIRDIVIILLLSVILASAMEPMVEYFNQKRIPRAVSVLTVYALVIGVAAIVMYLLIPPVAAQLQTLQAHIPDYSRQIQEKFGTAGFGALLTNAINELSSGSFLRQQVVVGTYGIFNGLFTFITVLVISFYLVAEQKSMTKFVATLVPQKHQAITLGLIAKIQNKMGLWIIGQLLLSFSIFILSLAGLLIIGLPNALVLALFAGIMEMVPYIGPFVSAVPAILIALIYNPPLALVVAIVYLIIQKTEGYILVPKIMEKTVGTSPLAVLLALLIGFKVAGIPGLLISVPLVSAITLVVHELWNAKTAEAEAVAERLETGRELV